MSKLGKTCIVTVVFFLCAVYGFSDTVFLRSGKEIKGIVVEDYQDRVVISTYEGEKIISKNNIKNIVYDLPEQNLVKLGDTYLTRKEYEKAYFCYEKAHRTNPDYALAAEKMNYVTGYLFRKQEQDKVNAVQRQEALENWQKGKSVSVPSDYEEELKRTMGFGIREEKGRIIIENITAGSCAGTAGLKEGDVLVSVWGRLTGYMPPEEAARLLLEESSGEIKIVIEREITLDKNRSQMSYQKIIGGKLAMLINGLTVVELAENGPGKKAGLLVEDEVTALDSIPTRYMPFKKAVNMIEKGRGDKVKFTVLRNATLWRG